MLMMICKTGVNLASLSTHAVLDNCRRHALAYLEASDNENLIEMLKNRIDQESRIKGYGEVQVSSRGADITSKNASPESANLSLTIQLSRIIERLLPRHRGPSYTQVRSCSSLTKLTLIGINPSVS